MCIDVLAVYVSVPHACLLFVKSRRGHWILWKWIMSGFEPPCGYCGLNLGPLEKSK